MRDRMDHLYNNPDMSDLQIMAVDELWSWGQTVKDFIVRSQKLDKVSLGIILLNLPGPQTRSVHSKSSFSPTFLSKGKWTRDSQMSSPYKVHLFSDQVVFYRTASRTPSSGASKLEIEGVPPIAVENLLEYCYKDRYWVG